MLRISVVFLFFSLIAYNDVSAATGEKAGGGGRDGGEQQSIKYGPLPEGADDPVVQIREGLLRGKFWTSRGGRKFNAFIGIPYAQPPINELRFMPPVPVKPWKGIRNATVVHSICPQRDIYRRSQIIEGEEDCLYLNVYTPKLPSDGSTKELFPVMFYMHGGGWLCGGGNTYWYGPETLLDENIVLVVPNYRLGALGFLSTGDNVVPGNNGLKDQNLALKWVKENIAKLGGDPNRVTLFGQSAGGASIQHHMASPLSKNLFSGGISQSGSAHCAWAITTREESLKQTRKLAKAFHCPETNSQALVDCLRKIDPVSIIAQDTIFNGWDLDPMIPFRPVVEPDIEGAFITKLPEESFRDGDVAEIPWIVGLTSEDGAMRTAGIYGIPRLVEELNYTFNTVAPISMFYDKFKISEIATNSRKIREFYFGDKDIDLNTRHKVVEMLTDSWFMYCIDEAAIQYRKYTKQPIYYYLFGHRGSSSFTRIFGDDTRDYGVCHADDLQYLFPVGDTLFADTPQSEDDKKVTKILTTLWVNFARTGNPTPEITKLLPNKWHSVKDDNHNYFFIDSKGGEMQENRYLKRAKLWREVYQRESVDKNSKKDEL